jgi:hypothetical protein
MASANTNFPSGVVSGSGAAGATAGSETPCAWTLYFHDPEDTSWTPDSYKVIGVFRSFPDLWATLGRIGESRFLTGMFFLMRDPYPPLWENRINIRGGSYSIKVPEKAAYETFSRYAAAGVLNVISKDAGNQIVGVSISPKKGFHILKIWNVDSKTYHKNTEISLYGDGMILTDVIYKPHLDQKM